MAFNPLFGIGREPRSINVLSQTRIKQDNVGLASASNFPGTTESADLPNGINKLFKLQVQIFPTSSGNSIDSARFRVRVGPFIIADYKLPNSDSWANNIDDIIPVDYDTHGQEQLIVEYGPELADATGYNIGFSVTAFSVQI